MCLMGGGASGESSMLLWDTRKLEALEDRFPSTNVSIAPGVRVFLLMLT